MTRVQYVLALVSGALWLGGLGMILFLAAHDADLGRIGAAALGVGAGLWYAALRLRPRPLLVLGVLSAVLVGAYAWARHAGDEGPEPAVTDAELADTDLTSAEAFERGKRWLRAAIERMRGVEDYTMTFAKRERAKSLLGTVRLTDERLEMKIRHEPFSVYVKYLAPEAKKGTEAIYVEGRNEGKLVVHSSRPPLSMLGTMRLDPDDWRARIDQRYPITQAGLIGVAEECLRVAEADAEHLASCEVRLLESPSVAGRPCYGFEIENRDPKSGYELALIRVVFDQVWKVPVFTERWHYVDVDGKTERLLVETYTTTDLQLDAGLTDEDFDPENPEYGY